MLVDIGANLTHDSFDEDREAVLQRAFDADVRQLVITGATNEGSEAALSLARTSPALFATAGIHPHHAEETTPSVLENLRQLATAEEVRAIGETGLDYFRDFSPRDVQVSSFESHIALAIELELPMFLHEREAHPTFGEILRAHRDDLDRIVVHCFTGEREALYTYLDLDCYIGITGWICDERRGTHLHSLIRDIPADRLLIETDAPYLLPRTIRPRPKSRRNEPHHLTTVCATVAEHLNQSYESVASQTSRNAQFFFNLPTP